MGEWKTEILDKLCNHIQSGGTPKSDNEEYYIGEIPFVAIEDITSSNKYLLKTKKHISEEGLKNSAAWLVPKDSLMYSIYATLGSTLISKIDAATNQAILNLIVNTEKIDVEYLYYFLTSLKNQIHKYSAQTTQSNLNAAIVKAFEIKYPEDKPEQIRIAEILSTADETIAHTEALLAKYQRIKTGLMQDLLTKGIDENGNIRSKATHKFVVKNGVEVPEEWEVDTLGGLKPYITSGSRNWAEYYSIEGSAFIRIGNLTREHINLRLDDVQRVDVKNSSEGKRTKLVKDDIIISITADLGIIGVIPEKFEEAYINQHIALVRFYDENINPRFIGLFLASYSGVQQFDLLNDSGAKAGLSLRTIQNLKVVLPDYPEQCLIVSKIDSIDNHIQNEKLNLKKLQSLKTGLMQDLLSGKVSLPAQMIKEAGVSMDNKN